MKYFKKNRRLKKGQAMVEMVAVLGIYLFLIGFMITGFQLMHNKMVFSMAAYEGVRTAIAYDPSYGGGGYRIADAKNAANSILTHMIGQVKGGGKPTVTITEAPGNSDYFQCTVKGNIVYLFPIIDPDGKGVARELTLTSTFVMRKERP